MIHLGFEVRKEPIEQPIEDAGGEEGVDVADGEAEHEVISSVAVNDVQKERKNSQVLSTDAD